MALPVKFAQLQPGRQPMALFDQQFDAVEEQIQGTAHELANHEANVQNPHDTTADQVGAYTKSETDDLINPIATVLSGHVTDLNNPHATTAHQVGTYTSSEIDGLVGRYGFQVYPASGAITVPVGIANGSNYWVQSADGLTIVSYTNNAGTPVITAGVQPLPTDLGLQQSVLREYVNAMYSAVGKGSVKAVWDYQGPRTNFGSSATILTALTSLDPTPLTLGLSANIFTGIDPRPVYDPNRGVYFNAEAGFQISNGLLGKTNGDFGIIFSCDLNTVIGAIPTVSALPGSPAVGDLYLVNADTNTVFTPDVAEVLNQPISPANLVNGFFLYNNPTFGYVKGEYALFSIKNATSSFIKLSITHLGQIRASIFNGVGGSSDAITIGTVAMGSTTRCTFGIRRFGGQFSLWYNGSMVGSYDVSGSASVTNFNQLLINGDGRIANNAIPISGGIKFYMCGMAVADDMTQDCWLNFYNEAARRYRTPLIPDNVVLNILIGQGQSWFEGGFVVTDVWSTASGWNGMVNPSNSTNGGENTAITRDGFPNFVSSFPNLDQPNIIGPYYVAMNPLGNQDVGATRSPNDIGENQLPGFFARINSFPQGATSQWGIIGWGNGGATIDQMAFQSVVPLMNSIKTTPLTAADRYNKVMRQLAYMVTYAEVRGWIPMVVGMIWDQAHSGFNEPNYVTKFISLYDRFVTDVKVIAPASKTLLCSMQQANYSIDGVGNSTNSIVTNSYVDQQIIDIVTTARGQRPIYLTSIPYRFTSFIHPYKAAHRWRGEEQGLHWCDVYFNGQLNTALIPISYTYTIGGTTIAVKFPIRSVGGLQFRTNANNIDSLVVRNGVTTYGFTYFKAASQVTVSNGSPCVVTWASHGRLNGSKIQLKTLLVNTIQVPPAPLANYTTYYVVNATTNNFQLALTPGGTPINTTTSQIGQITAFDISTYVASVAITATDTVTVTLDNPIAAGDVVQYVGWDTRFGNLFDGPPVDGLYQDQDWTVAFVSGSPSFKLGLKNDISVIAPAFRKAL